MRFYEDCGFEVYFMLMGNYREIFFFKKVGLLVKFEFYSGFEDWEEYISYFIRGINCIIRR